MPANVLSSGLAPYIQGFRSARLTGPQAGEAASRLRVYAGSELRAREHLRNLQSAN